MSDNKFRVGDKVVCTDAIKDTSRELQANKVYTVAVEQDQLMFISLKEIPEFYYKAWRFKKKS